jgi:WD40 repeat protein
MREERSDDDEAKSTSSFHCISSFREQYLINNMASLDTSFSPPTKPAKKKGYDISYSTVGNEKFTIKSGYYNYSSADLAKLHKSDSVVEFPPFSAMWMDLYNDEKPSDQLSGGLVLIPGGGGKEGSGVNSGIIAAEVVIDKNKPPREAIYLQPIGYLDSNNQVVGSISKNPHAPELAVGIGAGAAIVAVDAETKQFRVDRAVQADFSPKDPICTVSHISSNGKLLITGGEEGIIRIFDCDRSNLLAQSENHKNAIISVDTDSSSKYLATTVQDKFIRVFALNSADSKLGEAASEAKSNAFAAKQLQLLHSIQAPSYTDCNTKVQFVRFLSYNPLTAAEDGQNSNQHRNGTSLRSRKTAAKPGQQGEGLFLLALVNISNTKRRSNNKRSELALYSVDQQGYKQLEIVKISSTAAFLMELSPNQAQLAIATPDFIYIYTIRRGNGRISFKLLQKERSVHDLPCTGLSFSPESLYDTSTNAGPSYLLSISADKTFNFIPISSKNAKKNENWLVWLVLLPWRLLFWTIFALFCVAFTVSLVNLLQESQFIPRVVDLSAVKSQSLQRCDDFAHSSVQQFNNLHDFHKFPRVPADFLKQNNCSSLYHEAEQQYNSLFNRLFLQYWPGIEQRLQGGVEEAKFLWEAHISPALRSAIQQSKDLSEKHLLPLLNFLFEAVSKFYGNHLAVHVAELKRVLQPLFERLFDSLESFVQGK